MLNLLHRLFSLPSRQHSRDLQTNVPNALEHSLLDAFFDLREAQAYYLGTRRTKAARDYAPELEHLILRFLAELKRTENATDVLNQFVFESATAAETEEDKSDVLSLLESVHPSGFKLIDPKSPVNFETLKTSYRKAALRYHPDKGGSTKKMQKVNEAYADFHSVLVSRSNSSPVASTGSPARERDARLFTFYTLGLLLHVRTDLWDVANALDVFYRLRDIDALDPALPSSIYSYSARATLLDDLEKLIKRLCASGRFDSGKRVFETYKELYRAWLPDSTIHDKNMSSLSAHLTGDRELRVVMNHGVQVKNAFKNSIISRHEFEYYKRKFSEFYRAEENKSDILEKYVDEFGFLDLNQGVSVVPAEVTVGPVPDPSLDGRVELLSSKQLKEYIQSFSEETSVRLVRKYEIVRLTDLLRSYISQEEHSVESIYEEISLIKELQPKNTRTSTPNLIERLIEVIEYVEGISPRTRNERLQVLHTLDYETARLRDWKIKKYGDNYHMVIDIHDPTRSVSLDGLIQLRSVYFKIMRETIQSIRKRIDTLRSLDLVDMD